MKKALIVTGVIGALLLVSTAIFAYGGGWQGYGHMRFGNGPMMRGLDLTAEQQDKIFALSQEFRQKMYENRNDSSKLAALRDEHRKAIESVLTDDQKKKVSGYRGMFGYGRMMRGLDLTAEQQDKIFALSQEFRQKMYENRNDSSKLAVLRDEHRKAVESVLTDDQKKKFDGFRGKFRDGFGPCGRGRW